MPLLKSPSPVNLASCKPALGITTDASTLLAGTTTVWFHPLPGMETTTFAGKVVEMYNTKVWLLLPAFALNITL